MPQNEYKPPVSSEFTKVWTDHYLLNFILVKNGLLPENEGRHRVVRPRRRCPRQAVPPASTW